MGGCGIFENVRGRQENSNRWINYLFSDRRARVEAVRECAVGKLISPALQRETKADLESNFTSAHSPSRCQDYDVTANRVWAATSVVGALAIKVCILIWTARRPFHTISSAGLVWLVEKHCF